MNQELCLRVLSELMPWSDDRAKAEFEWLRLMARHKYDGYRDFLAGARFVESLAMWLQQFAPEEREVAYTFVRTQLVYVGPAEFQRLVELLYPHEIQQRLLRKVATALGIPKYRVWADPNGAEGFRRMRRKTLFMGLSDGARIEILRHANVGVLSNEQIVVATQVDAEKWQDLLKNLRTDLGDSSARFAGAYLIDDFMGTGTSLLRWDDDVGAWKGKLVRFRESVRAAEQHLGECPFEPGWDVCVHYYVATHAAANGITGREAEARGQLGEAGWLPPVSFTFGAVLPIDLPVVPPRDAAFVALTQKYYDEAIRTRHTDVGGAEHLGLGFGGCALPLVLEHNTPNNSIALLWAETEGGERDGRSYPAMRPLFRRRQRHSE